MDSTRKWQIFTTADGSPTLIWSRDDGYVEKMHHSGGALTESLYIYGTALEQVLEHAWPARVLSLGLGLAYNEMIALAEMLKRNHDEHIWSFEAEKPLRESFEHWLSGESSELADIHQDVLTRVAAARDLDPNALKAYAVRAWREGRLELRGSFPMDATTVKDCTCVFYDAYSKKMDTDLWEENALVERLRPRLSPQCILSTYAATGSMKRALKTLGFRLLPRPGFLGKRESTLAIRGDIG